MRLTFLVGIFVFPTTMDGLGKYSQIGNFCQFFVTPCQRVLAVSSVGMGLSVVQFWTGNGDHRTPSNRSATNPQEFRVLIEPQEPRCEFSCFKQCRFFLAGVVHTQLLDISMRGHGGVPAWKDPNRGAGRMHWTHCETGYQHIR